MNHRQRNILTAILILAGILLIVLVSFHASQPPDVVAADAPPAEFSAERAARHLPAMASIPNPLGSTANTRVRNYIFGQLQELGLEPQIQATRHQHLDRVASLSNVLARIQGTGNGEAILFMGHYDSRISAPGASDDGSAVVTMLELIRMLQHHPPMENDMIFLFSDGEEFGLLGAQAFMARHPWTQDIGLVINFEAMGTNGQSLMFETGTNNLEVVRAFAKAVPYPVGNSLSVEIYNRMPNYTDFEVFKTLGYQGLNFAYIGNSFDYHTPGDNIENTDLRSIQHHGSYAAGLALYFGNRPLELEQEQNAVYFNTLGYGFAWYPYGWVPVVTILVLLAGVVITGFGIVRKRIHPVRMVSGLVSFAILLLILFMGFDALYQIIASYYPGNSFRLIRYQQQGILLGMGLLAISYSVAWFVMILKGVRLWQVVLLLALPLLLLWWSGSLTLLKAGIALLIAGWLYLAHRPASTGWDLSAGALLLWMIITGVTGFMVPGASYLFVWPLLFSLIPMAWILFSKPRHPGLLSGMVFLFFAIPVLAWYPQLMHLLMLAMGLPMAGAAMILAGLMMGLLVPLVYLMTREKAWLLNGLIFAAGLFFLLNHTMRLEYDARYRQSNAMTYALDARSGESFWLSTDRQTDSWKEQFLTSRPDSISLTRFFPYLEGQVPAKNAPPLDLQAAALEVISDSIHQQERVLQIQVIPKSPVTELTFFFRTSGEALAAKAGHLQRQSLSQTEDSNWRRMTYLAPPPEGIIMTLYAAPDDRLLLHLVETDYTGLPGQASYQPRPDHMMTSGDRTIITSSYRF